MNSPRSRGALSDWIAVRLLRRLEHEESAFYPDIDLRLSQEAPRDREGHLTDPQAVLFQRANEVLQTRYGVATGWIQDTISWMKVLRFIGCVIVLVVAFGMAEPWLSHEQTVNVEWLFGFLGMLIVSMTITTSLMILAGLGGRKQEPGSAGAPTRTFAKLLVVHWAMAFVLQRVLPAIQRRFRKQNREPSAEEIRQHEAVTEAGYDVMAAQSRRVALEAAATSNLVWLLLSLGVFLSLGKMGLFREYDFRWQATIVSTDFMKDASQWLSRPIAGWPLVEVPTDADVTWLATGKLVDDAGAERAANSPDTTVAVQQTRQRWGRLFLAFVLYYGVLPRALLTLIAFWLARRSWRQLRPDPADVWVRDVLARIETPPFSTDVTDHADEERQSAANALAPRTPPGAGTHQRQTANLDGTAGVAATGTAGAASGPAGTAETADSVADDAAATTTSGEPPGELIAVCSFDVPPPQGSWTSALALTSERHLLDLGNAGTRADRQRVTSTLREQAGDVGLLLVVANLLDNPDGLFEDFLQRTTTAIAPQARRGVILLGGERVRQRYGGDADQVAARVALWRRKAVALGVPHAAVLEFDAENQTAASRTVLHRQLDELRPKSPPSSGRGRGEIATAGQLSRATALIAGAAHRDVLERTPEELQADAARVHREIRELYQRQAAELDKVFRSVKIDTNRMRAAIRNTAGEATSTLDSLTHFSQMADRIGKYTSGLSARWAVAGGLLCGIGSGVLTVAAAPAALPALLPAAFVGAKTGLLGGVVGAHIKHIAAKLTGRSTKTSTGESPSATDPDSAEFSLDDLVRANALWALVLEFQGTREEDIAKLLHDILGNDDNPLTTSEAAQHWLSELVRKTDQAVSARKSGKSGTPAATTSAAAKPGPGRSSGQGTGARSQPDNRATETNTAQTNS